MLQVDAIDAAVLHVPKLCGWFRDPVWAAMDKELLAGVHRNRSNGRFVAPQSTSRWHVHAKKTAIQDARLYG